VEKCNRENGKSIFRSVFANARNGCRAYPDSMMQLRSAIMSVVKIISASQAVTRQINIRSMVRNRPTVEPVFNTFFILYADWLLSSYER
jgi:hypothetical protein